MKDWHKAIIVIVSILLAVFPTSKYAMSSNEYNDTSNYRVEYVTPESSKLKLSGKAVSELNLEACLVATVKVAKEGYVPLGIEVRTWLSPVIFTANISPEILDRLEHDSAVISIEATYKLRSF